MACLLHRELWRNSRLPTSVTYPIAITSATGFTLYVTLPLSRRGVVVHRHYSRRPRRSARRFRGRDVRRPTRGRGERLEVEAVAKARGRRERRTVAARAICVAARGRGFRGRRRGRDRDRELRRRP